MASGTTQHIQDFVRTIGKDIVHYRELLNLLHKQKALYLTFDSDALTQNIRQQVPILNQLNKTADLRSECMKNLGLPATELGVKRLLRALPKQIQPKITQQWHQLQALVHECQKRNQDNGQTSATFHELLCQITQPVQHTYEEQFLQR